MFNRTLRRRFALILAGYTLLVLCLWLAYHRTAFSYVKQNAEENIALAEKNLLAELDGEFSRMKLVSSVIAGSAYVQEFLAAEDVAAYYGKAGAVAEIIRKTSYPQLNTDTIVTITRDGSFYRFTGGVSNGALEEIYANVIGDGAPAWSVLKLDGAEFFCHISPVYPHVPGKTGPVGHVVTLSNLAKVRRMLVQADAPSGIDTAVVLDDVVLLSSNPELEGRMMAKMERQYGAVTVSQVTGTNLYAAAAVTRDALYAGERLFLAISAIMLAFLLITILLLYRMLSTRMIAPMLHRAETMQLGLLNTQIDAHFVVNTIVCIQSLSNQGQNEKAARAAGNLAEILNHLHGADAEVNVFDELENLNRYIEIMNIRGAERFAVDMDVDDRLSEYKLPAQVLQPIVENALTHGLGNKTEDCRLTVTGSLAADGVVFCIADNGTGMAPDALRALQGRLDDAARRDYPEQGLRGVALVNIQKRLRARYGAACGLSVSGAPGGGTTVMLHLPVIADR